MTGGGNDCCAAALVALHSLRDRESKVQCQGGWSERKRCSSVLWSKAVYL